MSWSAVFENPAGVRLRRAYLDTGSYVFEAFGHTDDEALRGLRRAWKKHQAQYRFSSPFSEYEEDVQLSEVRSGAGYRDREEIVP